MAAAISATPARWGPRAIHACFTWNHGSPGSFIRHQGVPRGTSATWRARTPRIPPAAPVGHSCSTRYSISRFLGSDAPALGASSRVPATQSISAEILAAGFTKCRGGKAVIARVAAAHLSGLAHRWGRVSNRPFGTGFPNRYPHRERRCGRGAPQSPGGKPFGRHSGRSPGERLACAYGDANLEFDRSRLMWEELAACHGSPAVAR
jgi:hypothetical protein